MCMKPNGLLASTRSKCMGPNEIVVCRVSKRFTELVVEKRGNRLPIVDMKVNYQLLSTVTQTDLLVEICMNGSRSRGIGYRVLLY